MAKPCTVAILPGFSEGRYQSRKLRQALTAADYRVINDAKTADIIIAHSAGCYLVPQHYRARAVVNIGYPYWPGKSLLRGLGAKLMDEYHRLGLTRWLKKTGMNSLMMLNVAQAWRSVKGWQRRKRHLQELTGSQIFLRNRYDTYCHSKAVMRVAGSRHAYISFPAYHDHLWDEPELYVHLIQSIV